jgi:transcriptional regulator with XRE-family HTH domain
MLEAGTLPYLPADEWAAITTALRLVTDPNEAQPPLAQGLAHLKRKEAAARRDAERPGFRALQPHAGTPWHLRLRLQRLRLGLTQAEAAREAGLPTSAVSLYEAGAYPITRARMEGLRDLSGALRLDLALPPLDVSPTATAQSRARALAVAATYPTGSPARLLRSARILAGWTVARTAGELGGAHSRVVEFAESLTAWPLAPSPALRKLCEIWDVTYPVTYTHTKGAPPATRNTFARAVAVEVDALCLQPEDVMILCGYGPHAWAGLMGDVKLDAHRWWRVARATSEVVNAAPGMTAPARLLKG